MASIEATIVTLRECTVIVRPVGLRTQTMPPQGHSFATPSSLSWPLACLLAVSALYLTGCDGNPRECNSHFQAPGGGVGIDGTADGICTDTPEAYKYCESYGGGQLSSKAAGTRWVTAYCQGIEPVCTPVPPTDGHEERHICSDGFVGEACTAIEVLAPDKDRGSYGIGDVDGDSDLDVLFEKQESAGDSLWLVEQTGPLAFATPRQLAAYEHAGGSILVGQLDGEGEPDIVIAGIPSQVVLRPSDGPAVVMELDFQVRGLVDLDEDGISEVIGAGQSSLLVYRAILAGPRDPQVVPLGADIDWVEVRAGQFGGDNRLDLVLGSAQEDTGLLIADDTGYTLAWSGFGLIRDLDGDGVADAIRPGVVDLDVGSMGSGEQSVELSSFPSGFMSRLMGDVDGDGLPDLVRTMEQLPNREDPANGRVGIALGQGRGRFGEVTIYDLADSYINPIRLVDMNGDGLDDLLAVKDDGAVLLASASCQPPG